MKKLLKAGVIAVIALGLLLAGYRHFVLVSPLLSQVSATLSDPDSAQFRDLKLYTTGLPHQSALCGEVNAKNRLGGYVGFRPFKVIGGADYVQVRQPDSALESAYASGELKWCDFDEITPWWGRPW